MFSVEEEIKKHKINKNVNKNQNNALKFLFFISLPVSVGQQKIKTV